MNPVLVFALLLLIAGCAIPLSPVGWPQPDTKQSPQPVSTSSGSPGDDSGCARRQARRTDDSQPASTAAGQVADVCKGEAIKSAAHVDGLPPGVQQAAMQQADARREGDAARAVGKERRADRREAKRNEPDLKLPYPIPWGRYSRAPQFAV